MKKCLINFTKYSDAALEARAQLILNSLTGNAHFTDPVPSLAELQAAITAFSAALIKAGSGNRSDIAFKNQKRRELVAILVSLAQYVTFVANGDESILYSSGFEISKTPGTIIITRPENLQVINGNNTGELQISVNGVKGALSYLFEYTTDATQAASNWQSIASSRVKFMVDGLQPGTVYYCRVGAVGGNNQLQYSDIVSRMVI